MFKLMTSNHSNIIEKQIIYVNKVLETFSIVDLNIKNRNEF